MNKTFHECCGLRRVELSANFAAAAVIAVENLKAFELRFRINNSWLYIYLGSLRLRRSDYLALEVNLNSVFNIAFPSRDEWDRGEIEKYTEISKDGSKLDNRVVAGVFAAKLDTRIFQVFQA